MKNVLLLKSLLLTPSEGVKRRVVLCLAVWMIFTMPNIVIANPDITSSPFQDVKTITGVVTDAETNEGLPGVSILEKGTTRGTVTDLDGKFSISVSSTAIIQVSFIGYFTEEFEVATADNLEIALKPEMVSLDDVIVIGYGTVKKSDLTGSVASISAEDLQQSAVASVDQALQGRTAGVNVTAQSGTPGQAPSVRIRGMGSITGADPFYVVDGMPMSASAIGSLNPSDIERMEVLKDASAAAIYGSRAANGVILITTKQGKKGTNQVSFDAYTGIQSLAKKHDLLDAKGYISLRNAAGHPWEDSSAVSSTDWQEEIFRPAKMSNYNLAFTGGTEVFRYALTGSYFNQDGIVKGSDYKRYTARVNMSVDVKPWLTIGENFNIINSKQNVIPEQNEYTSVIISALTMDPAMEARDSAGVPAASERNNIFNPVGILERNHNKVNENKILGNLYMVIKPVEWLEYKIAGGIEYANKFNEIYYTDFYESVSNQRPENALFNGNYSNKNWLIENTLTFKKEIAKHSFQALVGYSKQKNVYRQDYKYASNVSTNEDLWYFSNYPDSKEYDDITNGNFNGVGVDREPYDATLASYLGRVIYSWNNIFDFTGSVRRDGSSKFGANQKWGVFPSFAAGLKLSNLPVLNTVEAISFLKLRAGWGQIGNQEIGDYGAFTQITPSFNYTLGAGGAQTSYPGGAPTSYANKFVQWETTIQTNIGLDLNLLRNSLTFNVDYYTKKTEDMLVAVPVPGVSGIQVPPIVNFGSVKNSGIELNASYKQKLGDLSITVSGNIAFMQNEVTELGEADAFYPSAPFRSTNYIARTQAGEPIASFYGFVTDGYWQNQGEIDAANKKAEETYPDEENVVYDRLFTSPGDRKFKDLNGDNRITSEDQTFIGSPHPDYAYGININLEYKNFDFTLFGQGVGGNEIFMATKFYLESPDSYWNGMPTMNDHWENEGDNTEVPRLDLRNQNNNLRFSDHYVEKGAYFRIKNIQLGYTLPSEITEKMKLNRLRVYVSGQNLLTFSKYKGFDPEIGIGQNQGNEVTQRGILDIGIDRGMYPIARSYMIGINLTF